MKKNVRELFVFRIGEEYFAIDIACTKEIKSITHITPVHDAPWYIRGIINLRGKIVTIFDIPAVFSGSAKESYNRNQKILITAWQGEDIGLMVDDAHDIIECRSDRIHPAPPNLDTSVKASVKYVYTAEDSVIPILDPDSLLSMENKERTAL
ncbi:MAG: chemotaxis protein CheW [Fibrobacterota bacterium]